MNIGIICEYNPFHNGHLYHLDRIKNLYPDSNIILVMSGNITQRGDISIVDKWDKTSIALKYGVDLVIELPFIYACNSSDKFAYGAIKILKELSVDKIVFGSEINDIDVLKNLASIQINNKEYDILVKGYLSNGFNYPTACGKALFDLTNININTPNDILGLGYIKEIMLQNAPIEPVCIKRTNDYHSTSLNSDIVSATSIREAIKNKKNISNYVPSETLKYLNDIKYLDDYFNYIKYHIISCDISNIYEMNEEIRNRIYKYINVSNNLDELICNIKSKNYTYNRIRRLMVYILFNITNDDYNNFKDYIRILGFNKNGKKHLNEIKKNIEIPIITNYSNSNNLLTLDNKIYSILNIILPIEKQCEIFNKEIKEKVRIIIDNDVDIC